MRRSLLLSAALTVSFGQVACSQPAATGAAATPVQVSAAELSAREDAFREALLADLSQAARDAGEALLTSGGELTIFGLGRGVCSSLTSGNPGEVEAQVAGFASALIARLVEDGADPDQVKLFDEFVRKVPAAATAYGSFCPQLAADESDAAVWAG